MRRARVRRRCGGACVAVACCERACGVGRHAAGCGTRRVTLPAMRGETCCYPRGVSKAVSTTHPPASPGPSCRIWCWATVTRPQRPNCRWATDQPGVDEEAVARQVWVLPRSDVSSAWVMQQSQQWSLRQTWALCAEFGVPGDVTARACAKTSGERSRHPCRGLCLAAPSYAHRDSAGWRARESRRVGAWRAPRGAWRAPCVCGVRSEARSVVRAWRDAHRVMRWQRGSAASAERERSQARVARTRAAG